MPFPLSQLLDAARWMGALTVLALHATNIFVSLTDIMSAPHAAPVYAWWAYASVQLGHQAVVGFFVMSGYLVGGAALAQLRKGEAFLSEYLVHRVARIYVVLVPALLLTLALDSFGRAFVGVKGGVYDWPMFEGHFAPWLLFANLLNLQDIHAPYLGVNGPLWSLACEFWYYVTFPLLLLPAARVYPAWLRAAGFALGVALFVALSASASFFSFGYALWALGALGTLATRPLVKSRWLALALLAGALILIRFLVRGPLLESHPWLHHVGDVASALSFLALILALRFDGRPVWGALRPRLHKSLAAFSFSLYSVHMPILIFCRAGAERLFGLDWAPPHLAAPSNWAALALAMALSLGVAYAFSRVTEARTGEARRVLRAALARGRGVLGAQAAPGV